MHKILRHSHFTWFQCNSTRTRLPCIILLCSACLSPSIAPPGINPLEHEELPMSIQQVQQNVRPTLAAVPPMSTERQRGAFSQMTALQPPFPVTSNNTYILYRARKDNRDVILRMLKGRKRQTSERSSTACRLKKSTSFICSSHSSEIKVKKNLKDIKCSYFPC